MAVCPTCSAQFLGDEQFCPRDGTPLRAGPPADPLSGRVLSGRYRLMNRLGQGGMGAVYRAHHILMDKPVAVKVLRSELSSDAEAVARFHREARSASRLDHHHIIRVTDFGQSDDGLLFLVMELLDGESLSDVLRRGPLPWRQAVAIGREVAMGLSHAHEQGIIHRDLKPENIILSKRPGRSSGPVVKVLDFGLAKLVHETTSDSRQQMSLTKTGVVFGTPEYMSPEQAEGLQLDHRTDIYALGVICYQMVTGEVPFSASTFLALMAKTVQEPPVPPSQRCPDAELPAALEALILRCLEKRPQQRPQSADDVILALEQIAEAAGIRSAASGSRNDGQPRESASAPTAQSAQALSAPDEAFAHTQAARVTGRGTDPGSTPAQISASPSGLDEADAPVRRRWPLMAAALVVVIGAALPLWHFGRRTADGGASSATPAVEHRVPNQASFAAPKDPLAQAETLLRSRQADQALALLSVERKRNNSAAVQRLLSAAYEAKANRLRALGHMHLSLAMAESETRQEQHRSQLALAQLLSRMGYPKDACKVTQKLLSEQPGAQQKAPAEALARELRCL